MSDSDVVRYLWFIHTCVPIIVGVMAMTVIYATAHVASSVVARWKLRDRSRGDR